MPKHNNKSTHPTSRPRHAFMTPSLRIVLAILLPLAIFSSWLFFQNSKPASLIYSPAVTSAPQPLKTTPAPAAKMVDEQQCQGCHGAQVSDWQGSHHQLAMQSANAETVLANFSDITFKNEGETTRFSHKNDGFWVNTPGADGKPADFKVAYTFGVAPLQQYLIETPGGRLQALGVAWDTEKHRWFHLYPGQGVNFKNPLHWSKPSQNANFMCVECHTTGFKRNFDTVSNSFASQWNSLGVGCQACHGPASNHLAWAAKPNGLAHAGFAVDLKDNDATTEIETCARCHARRAPLDDGYQVGNRLMDDYLPSVLTPELYAVDGKIKDEVFEYGSFLQSKMFDKGVRCSNCHNPHSTALKDPGNGVCVQCHNTAGATSVERVNGKGLQAKNYDSPEHHRHQVGKPGSQCVDCHMPGKLYMGNDFRHDHSFSIPNPLRAQTLGTPDACLSCHQRVAGNTIIEQFKLWIGDPPEQASRYDESLSLIRGGQAGAAQALYEQLQRSNLPAIQRATLLAELPAYPSAQALRLVTKDLNNPAPHVRESAVRAVSALMPEAQRLALLSPRLDDPVRAVRIAAARALPGAANGGLGASQPSWNTAIGEYEAVQSSLMERAEANLNLAMLYQASGRNADVEPRLRAALQRDPDFFPALVTLVEWLESNARGKEARQLLDDSLREHPDIALLHQAQGLAMIRAGQRVQAIPALRRAARLEPQNAQYGYVLAVALYENGQVDEACSQLEQMLEHQPANRNARLLLIQYDLKNGHEPKARRLIEAWTHINPEDPALR